MTISQALDAWAARDNGCGGALIVGKTHGEAGQWFSLVPVDQFVADPSLDCPSSTSAPTTAAPTTPAPTEANTASTVDLDGLSSQCTEDGSNVLATEFVVQNVKE